MHHLLLLRIQCQCMCGACIVAEVERQTCCSAPDLKNVHGCRAQKYRLYLKRLAGVPLNAPISAEALQRVQEVQQVWQTWTPWDL